MSADASSLEAVTEQPGEKFAPARVRPNARHALAGIWRLNTRRFFSARHWLTVLGMLGALVLFSVPAARVDGAPGFLPWAAGFYGCFVVPLLSFITAAGAMRDELGAGTVDYVFTRAVPRPHYIVFRYLTQLGISQIDFLFGFATVIGIGAFWSVPDLLDALPSLLLAQVAGVTVFSAVGLLCGLITSRYVIIGLVYGAVVEVGLGSVPTQLNQISLVRHLLSLVRPLLGEGGWAVTRIAEDDVQTAMVILTLVAVSVAAIACAAGIFSFRQFAGEAARDH